MINIATARKLATLIAAVDRGDRAEWMTDNSDRTTDGILRGFTYDGGGFIGPKDDIRDGYVWISGIVERWIPVRHILAMMDAQTIVFH